MNVWPRMQEREGERDRERDREGGVELSIKQKRTTKYHFQPQWLKEPVAVIDWYRALSKRKEPVKWETPVVLLVQPTAKVGPELWGVLLNVLSHCDPTSTLLSAKQSVRYLPNNWTHKDTQTHTRSLRVLLAHWHSVAFSNFTVRCFTLESPKESES